MPEPQVMVEGNNEGLQHSFRFTEDAFAEELHELAKFDTKPRPHNWNLSPWAVVTYLIGGKLDNGFEIEPKYFGSRRLMEIAVATLATDRALLLIGWNKSTKSNAPIVHNGSMAERAQFMFY